MRSLLNIGAGKINPIDFTDDFSYVIHLDRSYENYKNDTLEYLEKKFYNMSRKRKQTGPPVRGSAYFIGMDMYEFLDKFRFKFDVVNADRIFEHQFYDAGEIGRLLDACNQITEDDAELIITVPNHLKLAKQLIGMEEGGNVTHEPDAFSPSKFAAHVLLQCTEWQNTRSDPHGSVWTPQLAQYYIESEGGTWKIDKIEDDISLKGRECYMRITCRK